MSGLGRGKGRRGWYEMAWEMAMVRPGHLSHTQESFAWAYYMLCARGRAIKIYIEKEKEEKNNQHNMFYRIEANKMQNAKTYIERTGRKMERTDDCEGAHMNQSVFDGLFHFVTGNRKAHDSHASLKDKKQWEKEKCESFLNWLLRLEEYVIGGDFDKSPKFARHSLDTVVWAEWLYHMRCVGGVCGQQRALIGTPRLAARTPFRTHHNQQHGFGYCPVVKP